MARPNGALVLFAIIDPSGGVSDDLWSRERAGPNNAWQRWEWRGGLLHDLPLESGEIHDPTLVLLPEPDASGGALVLLFLRIAGKVSLHRLRSANPLGWIADPMKLQPPP